MASWLCGCWGLVMTLTKVGWRHVVFAILGESQYYKTADGEVELKNVRIGSCRRVNITRLGIKHGRHCGSVTIETTLAKLGILEHQYKMMEMLRAKAQKLQN
jgi:hypothetical protein